MAGCKRDKFANLYGSWRFDVEHMKRQALNDLLKSDTVKVDTIAAKLSLDTLFKPIESVVMEYKPKGELTAHTGEKIEKGIWRVSRDEKYFVTRIGGLEKIYEIQLISADKILFKETRPNTTIKEFILYPVK